MSKTMDNEIEMLVPLGSDALFAVGDRVTATVMIDGHDADDWPYVIYCKKGDELEIRECRPNGWYVVAHPHREPGAGFMARHRELSPANAFDVATKPAPDGFEKHE